MHIAMLSSSCWHHRVISTDPSSCHHHLVISTDASSCYHHLVTRVRSNDKSSCHHLVISSQFSTDASSCYHHLVTPTLTRVFSNDTVTHRHALIFWFVRVLQTHRRCYHLLTQSKVAWKSVRLQICEVIRKRIRKGSFGLPKSSFGEHKVDARHSAKADIAHRLANQSMCDESPMMRVVIFLAKSDKSRGRAVANRIGRCAMMRVVIETYRHAIIIV
jgi:hypothetical protein